MDRAQQNKILNWFQINKRPLPWRETNDPYKIWVSEVMLQQTTTTAVIPYFKNFICRFPTLERLAKADLEEVYENWAGLGYYSRARNLHKCAQQIYFDLSAQFPNNHTELIKLPGFGPYTSRSVSSLAFGEAVGVLDGNVIRVLSRYHNKAFHWWKTAERTKMQELVDSWVKGIDSNKMNQALMELGSTICIPQSPKCILCPLMGSCTAQKKNSWASLPAKKPKKPKEIWLWDAHINERNRKIFMIKNEYAPFLKNSWFVAGKARKLNKKPEAFDFRHTITHHEIYVRIKNIKGSMKDSKAGEWVNLADLQKRAPATLIKKAIQYALDKKN